jgi:hypothetical protein
MAQEGCKGGARPRTWTVSLFEGGGVGFGVLFRGRGIGFRVGDGGGGVG